VVEYSIAVITLPGKLGIPRKQYRSRKGDKQADEGVRPTPHPLRVRIQMVKHTNHLLLCKTVPALFPRSDSKQTGRHNADWLRPPPGRSDFISARNEAEG